MGSRWHTKIFYNEALTEDLLINKYITTFFENNYLPYHNLQLKRFYDTVEVNLSLVSQDLNPLKKKKSKVFNRKDKRKLKIIKKRKKLKDLKDRQFLPPFGVKIREKNNNFKNKEQKTFNDICLKPYDYLNFLNSTSRTNNLNSYYKLSFSDFNLNKFITYTRFLTYNRNLKKTFRENFYEKSDFFSKNLISSKTSTFELSNRALFYKFLRSSMKKWNYQKLETMFHCFFSSVFSFQKLNVIIYNLSHKNTLSFKTYGPDFYTYHKQYSFYYYNKNFYNDSIVLKSSESISSTNNGFFNTNSLINTFIMNLFPRKIKENQRKNYKSLKLKKNSISSL